MERSESTVRYWLLDGVVPAELLSAAKNAVPSPLHPGWIRYENDCEKHKWALESELPTVWRNILDTVAALNLADLTGIESLQPSLYGAGIHLMFPGGHLSPHLDYALHPSGLERRLNAILSFDDSEDGCLEFYDASGAVQRSIPPRRGRLCIFECSDLSFHGVSRCTSTRLTAALYFLAPPRGVLTRRKAMFLPCRKG